MAIVRLRDDARASVSVALPSGRVLSVAPGNLAFVLDADLKALDAVAVFIEVQRDGEFVSLATPATEPPADPTPDPDEPEA